MQLHRFEIENIHVKRNFSLVLFFATLPEYFVRAKPSFLLPRQIYFQVQSRSVCLHFKLASFFSASEYGCQFFYKSSVCLLIFNENKNGIEDVVAKEDVFELMLCGAAQIWAPIDLPNNRDTLLLNTKGVRGRF